MTAVADRTEFLQLLEMSKLIDADVLAAVRLVDDFPDEPSEVAERLIQQGILTRFQTKQLLAGRHRGFVLGPYRLLDQIGPAVSRSIGDAAKAHRVVRNVRVQAHATRGAAVVIGARPRAAAVRLRTG